MIVLSILLKYKLLMILHIDLKYNMLKNIFWSLTKVDATSS